MFYPQSPTTIYTLLELLRARFASFAISDIRHLRSGINHSYLVITPSDKFILRVYHPDWRSKEGIISESNILRHLAGRNIPVSFPIADDLQEYVQTIKLEGDELYGMLFSFAAGNKIKHQSIEQHERNGICMANMHAGTPEHMHNRFDYSHFDFVEQAAVRIKQYLVRDEQTAIISEAMQLAKAYYDSSAIYGLPQGLVHLDFWADNMHITTQGALTVFDFDFCGHGYFSMDIAYYLLQLRAIERDIDQYTQCRDGFLRGYATVRRIQADELDSMRPFTLALLLFYLGVQCDRTDWSSSFLNDSYIQHYIDDRLRPVLAMIS